MLTIGFVIGMGIFRTSKDAAHASLTPSIFFLAWIFGGIVAFFGALTFAEIGSRYPMTGGYYKIFTYAYHPSIAFAINCIILISNAAAVSGVALIGVEYIAPLLFKNGTTDFVKALIAMSAIILFYGVNLKGLRMSSQTQNVLMILKIGMVVLLISSLFFPGLYNKSPQPTVDLSTMSFGAILLSFGVALKATCFTYGGYQQIINFGEEVERPQKNIPRGLFIGMFLIVSLYLAVSYAYYKVIGFNELKESSGIAATIVEKMFGSSGSTIASILLFTAVLAYVNVLLLSNPRVMYAMSEDGILPAAFKKKDEKKGVLTISLTVFASICVIVLFFAKQFNQILSFTIFLDSIGMATSASTIFILRKRTKHLNGTGIFSMKLYPIIPLVFIATYIFVGIMIGVENWRYAVIGTSVFLVFLLIYFITQKFRKQTS